MSVYYAIEYVYPNGVGMSTDAEADEVADVIAELVNDGATILMMSPGAA